MPWHRAYVGRVLAPDHTFAAQHLHAAFLDAMTAHVRTVARLPVAAEHAATLARLEAALARQRDEPPPPPEPDVPDLYFALQRRLAEDVGDAPLGWLRLGLSRNDLDMTVYLLAARQALLRVAHLSGALRAALLDLAEGHLDTVIIARTHHQPAQPTTLAHYLTAAGAMIGRDHERLLGALARLDRCPLGAAALAGSSHPLDRPYAAAALGFARPVENTYDAVASADWQMDLAALGQTMGVGLSRLVHDLVDAAAEGWLRLPDDLVQGSSIMPQKRNPVVLEHARTRLSRAAGAAQMVAFSGHNVPYGDVNDVGPDVQEALSTLLGALEGGLELLVAALAGAEIDEARLASAAAATDTTATELADELVRTCGLPFPEAHRVVAALVTAMAQRGRPLQQAGPDDLVAVGGPVIGADAMAEALSPAAFIRRRSGMGGPAPEVVRAMITRSRAELAEYHRVVDATAARIDAALRHLRTPGKDTQA